MSAPNLTIWIGWDSKEPVSAAVLAHSILTHASLPVTMGFVTRRAVSRIYTRPRGTTEATEFSLTRFLVPYLSRYEGYSLFLDCDMLMCADVLDMLLYPLSDPNKAVWVCPHDYVPRQATKFLGNIQTVYPRKNWSSVMLFDNAQCRALTPDYVNTATGADLHRFAWLKDEQIGHLPLEWNFLVNESSQSEKDPRVIHWTNGGPWFDECRTVEHADRWFAMRDAMLCVSVQTAVAS